MAQEVGSRSLRSLDLTSCLPRNSSLKCFVWCYGPEFVARDLRLWLEKTGTKTMYIEPGSPWENGYCESFNSKMRDEFLNGEVFYSIQEVRVLAERWRVYYNTIQPHSSLGYKPPAPEAWLNQVARQDGMAIATLSPSRPAQPCSLQNSEIAALH